MYDQLVWDLLADAVKESILNNKEENSLTDFILLLLIQLRQRNGQDQKLAVSSSKEVSPIIIDRIEQMINSHSLQLEDIISKMESK